MKILFVILTSREHNHDGQIIIDRVDLTRKLDNINTWVQDAILSGHDVLFFDGGNEVEYYDELSKTLHVTDNDGYETRSEPSRLFKKTQSAFRWILKNKKFDYLYIVDDDVYINIHEFLKIKINHDFVGCTSGGKGYFYNKKSMQVICDVNNTNVSVADNLIYLTMVSAPNITKSSNMSKHSPQYFPGELYATVHYVTGKRSYFLHNILKHFHENGVTNRKIILGGPLDSMKKNEIVSYESKANKTTSRWYDFTTDPNGWEYHGGYIRSYIHLNNLKEFWPYADNATKYFVINVNNMLSDYVIGSPRFYENLNFLVEKCERSLTNKNNLLLCSSGIENINGWTIDNSVKESLKLNFELLNGCNFYKK